MNCILRKIVKYRFFLFALTICIYCTKPVNAVANVAIDNSYYNDNKDIYFQGSPVVASVSEYDMVHMINGTKVYHIVSSSNLSQADIKDKYNIYVEIPEITENYNEDLDFQRETAIRMMYLFNNNTSFNFDKNKKTLKVGFVNKRFVVAGQRFAETFLGRHNEYYLSANVNEYHILEMISIFGVDMSNNKTIFNNTGIYEIIFGIDDEQCKRKGLSSINKDDSFVKFAQKLGYNIYKSCDIGKRNFDEFLFKILAKSVGMNYSLMKEVSYQCDYQNICDVDKFFNKYINGN